MPKTFSTLTNNKKVKVALAQVKAGNTSEKILNEIRQIISSLHRLKEIRKKVYNNIMNSVKIWN